jgi:TonB family protein
VAEASEFRGWLTELRYGSGIASLISIRQMTTSLLALPSPRLPVRMGARMFAPVASAGALHLLAAILIALALPAAHTATKHDAPSATVVPIILPPRMIFLPDGPPGGGGGGGGNQQSGPIRHAEGIGRDALTMRTTKRPPTVGVGIRDTEPAAVVLDALPLACGTTNQLGLPVGGVSYGTSQGPGSGGGVGTGVGTGIGSGSGPGVGPGSGGGFGGGAYRPGGAVVAPRLISQEKPHYTPEALERKIQGSVWLEVVVTREGHVGSVRVTRSLDPGGLDEQAIIAVRRWQFEPGRLAGTPVDVMVTVAMDFTIR